MNKASFYTTGFDAALKYQVNRQPENIALAGMEGTVTYAGLSHELCLISNSLQHQQPPKNVPIALLLDHSDALIKAILSVHLSGNCYTPLDVSFPPARLKKALASIQPSILITEQKYFDLATSCSDSSITVLLIDTLLANETQSSSTDDVFKTLAPTDYAYLLTTSGTTGEPKGIVHNQRSLMRSVNHYISDLEVDSYDNIGLILPCTYTPSVFCIFGAIATGATLCTFDLKQQSFNAIIDWIEQQHITLLYCSPSLFRSLMKECNDPNRLASIRSVQLAGEPLFRSDVLAYQARFSNTFDLYNGMGSSETSCLSRFFIDKDTVVSTERVPIGLPYDDVDFYICDEKGNQLPDGQEGDLIVEGAFFTDGYWQRPDLTKEKFSNASTPAKRRYQTGDRAVRQHDGNIVHLGRSDDQIKLRGQRVELAAIESTILLSELAANAVALLIELEGKSPFIAAFVAPVVDVSKIREYLSSQLPPFMIPTRIVAMNALPINTSGKVDRQHLKHYDFIAIDNPEENVVSTPINIIEKRIVNCFQEVLQNKDIHVNSDFFAEGGDSIGGVEIAIAMERELSTPINVSALIEAPTPAKMSQLVKRSIYVGKSETLVKFQTSNNHEGDDKALPLFCLPGLPGNALAFRALAAELTDARTVYAFVYPGQDGCGRNFTTVDEFVSTCLLEINAIYPTGPVALACYSIGGTIGFELVRRLKDSGRKIALMAMIDCYSPNNLKEQHVRAEGKLKLKRLFHKAENSSNAQREDADAAITNAVFHYKTAPQSIENTLLIKARDEAKSFTLHDRYAQWHELIRSNITIFEVSGTHTDMLKLSKAPEIGSILNAFLPNQNDACNEQPTFSMKSLSDIWTFRDTNSLVFEEVNQQQLSKVVHSLLAEPLQLTERLQLRLNEEVRSSLITSQQKGRFYTRKVALQTKNTHKTAVVAAIQIDMNLFDRDFATAILQTDVPFGTILKDFAIEYSCDVVTIFKVEPDTSLFKAFDNTRFTDPLYGRCNRFTDAQGRLIANVMEIIAPWV